MQNNAALGRSETLQHIGSPSNQFMEVLNEPNRISGNQIEGLKEGEKILDNKFLVENQSNIKPTVEMNLIDNPPIEVKVEHRNDFESNQ